MGYSRWIIATEQRLPEKSIMVILGYYIIRSDLRHNYIRISFENPLRQCYLVVCRSKRQRLIAVTGQVSSTITDLRVGIRWGSFKNQTQ